MSDVTVQGGLTRENAILLLAAVEELGEDPAVVRTTTHGFVAPEGVVKQAGLNGYDPHEAFNAEIEAAMAEVEAHGPALDFPAPEAQGAPTLDDEGNLVEPPETVLEVKGVPAAGTSDSSVVECVLVKDEPKKNDNKAAWVDFAVSQGADRDEADSATKNDLIDKYGTKE